MAGDSFSQNIRKNLLKLLKGAADVAESTIELTRTATMRYMRSSGARRSDRKHAIEGAVEETITGAIKGGSDARTDLASVAKAAIIGTIEGASSVTKVSESVVKNATRAAMRGVRNLNADPAEVARKAVEGAIEASRKAGLDAQEAARAAVAGAIEGAQEVSDALANRVAKAVTGTIAGVKVSTAVPTRKPLILIVDNNRAQAETLGQSLITEGYETRVADSMMEADSVLQEIDGIKLILIDISGFDRTFWDQCGKLRGRGIPFVVIAPQRSPLVQQESLKCGASGVLVKPISAKEMTDHIKGVLAG